MSARAFNWWLGVFTGALVGGIATAGLWDAAMTILALSAVIVFTRVADSEGGA